MVEPITYSQLAWSFLPVLIVLFFIFRLNLGLGKASSALARMLLQLLTVGFALLWVFEQAPAWAILSIVITMMLIASWLALNVSASRSFALFIKASAAVFIGGAMMLAFITQWVLSITPWYNPQYLIPLGGMIFSSSMTGISLALERYEADIEDKEPKQAFYNAINAAMIPVINSMLAVGLVSLPGMMTGQILSGVEPFLAARYQILVMTMVFSSTGLTVFSFMFLYRKAVLRSDS